MEKSSFFNAKNIGGEWDRTYTAEDFANYFATVLTNGIFPNQSTNLQVIANNNMTVTVKQGSAFINGYMYHNDEDLVIDVEVADGVLKRIDSIVVRLDHNNREIKTYIKKGINASNPSPPQTTRDEFKYELCLGQIFITPGLTNITQANITDVRYNSVECGIVNSLISVDTTEIYSQLRTLMETKENSFNKWFSDLQTNLSGDVAGNLQNQINQLESELLEGIDRKYMTSGAVKEFTTNKDGIAEIFSIKGNTKILNEQNIECNPWDAGAKIVSVGQGNNITIRIANSEKNNELVLPYTLRAVGDVKDEIIVENDQVYLIQRCGEIVINGSEIISGPEQYNTKTMRFDIKMNDIMSNNKNSIICNKFAVGNAYSSINDFECITNYNSDTLCIRIEKVRLGTWNTTEFKKWLRANPITLVYEMKEPVKIKIPNICLNSYKGVNTLNLKSGVIKSECEFNVTENLINDINAMKKGIMSVLNKARELEDYKNRRLDGTLKNIHISYLNNLNSGFYRLDGCTGFPYGWGQIVLIKNTSVSYSIIYFNYEINMSTSGMYINSCQGGEFSGWQKVSLVSNYAFEVRVSGLEQENADLTYALMEAGVL